MDYFSLLNDMIRLQREHGASRVDATAHGWNQLKMALAALRRKNPALYAVKLCAEQLAPEDRFRAPSGGIVTVRLTLVARPETETASGPQAARMRARGTQVDGFTRAPTSAEIAEEAQFEQERLAYELWKRTHPNGTFEEACAAGHEAEATADKTAQEILERRQAERRTNERRSGGDFFAEFEKKLFEGDKK